MISIILEDACDSIVNGSDILKTFGLKETCDAHPSRAPTFILDIFQAWVVPSVLSCFSFMDFVFVFDTLWTPLFCHSHRGCVLCMPCSSTWFLLSVALLSIKNHLWQQWIPSCEFVSTWTLVIQKSVPSSINSEPSIQLDGIYSDNW